MRFLKLVEVTACAVSWSVLLCSAVHAQSKPAKTPIRYVVQEEQKINDRLWYVNAWERDKHYPAPQGAWFAWKHVENGKETLEWKFHTECIYFEDMYFKNVREGWLWSNCGEIYRTKDSGVTWTKMSESKYLAGRYAELYALTGDTIFLSSHTDNFGPSIPINVLISRDAGQTWKVLTREDILTRFGLTEDEYKSFDWVLGKSIRNHLEKTPNQKVGENTKVPGDPTNRIPGSFEWDPGEWRRKHPGLPDPPPDKRNLAPDQYPGPPAKTAPAAPIAPSGPSPAP